jgi:hypothetical protein
MERSKALMIPMTSVSFESSGFGVTVTSDPNPGISNSIITRITDTAISKGKHLSRSSDRRSFSQSYCLPDSNLLSSLLFRMEAFPLFDSSEVTESWTSSESILKSQGIWFTLTSGPEFSLACIKSRSTLTRRRFSVYLTGCPPRQSLNLNPGYLCIDTS